ncbi:transglutaminase-like domain-containing protein [Helicobacter mustelae]|uniref:Putative KatA associated protein, KapA n=1 Tax=Helicobacter mustelae (strain ATCC 43772 / CCUG 25715 / CIP 103759 / LMG 18044 / NCTC 12198 / R85-136P) TaxID=679897 RepID=D3UIM7_HELM1|nr:transglutaminase family protein [Helicobacter mustelae]CBG40352.1 putative KatA associated protein, KapA [Helicobacter mustelae 12198]SQH71852.1 KatA associated protein KapA [Helicobacter mustelae]STP12991.1 KatA associated protein KapA [Helicobacter mustelae]
MERREFLKTSALATGVLATSTGLFAREQKSKKFIIDIAYSADFRSAKDLKFYTPLPMPSAFQKISNFKLQGNFTSHNILKIQDSPLLFAQFEQTAEKKDLSLSFVLELEPYQAKLDRGENSQYLKQTRYVRTDGKIAEIASLVKNKSTEQKVAFFKDYIAKNILPEQRSFSDAIKTISDKKNTFILSGESISANSILVALCRACNIPAREVFGFDITQNHLISNNKAEILINHYWQRMDVSQENSYDFIALNHLRDDFIGDIYTSSIHQTLGSIDGNNLKYYKEFQESIRLQQIA